MSQDERTKLEAMAVRTRPPVGELVWVYLWFWACLIGVFALLWALSAWLGRVLFDVRFDWDSRWAPVIWTIGIGACTCYLGYVVLRQLYAGAVRNRSVAADLRSDLVEEHRLELREVKRFQEPEHGGLIYFFLTDEGKVFVLYDYESQDLGVSDADPLTSAFRPCRVLTLVRAPTSHRVLNQVFSGAPFELAAPLKLTVKPGRWPASEAYCETPWNQLEATYAV